MLMPDYVSYVSYVVVDVLKAGPRVMVTQLTGEPRPAATNQRAGRERLPSIAGYHTGRHHSVNTGGGDTRPCFTTITIKVKVEMAVEMAGEMVVEVAIVQHCWPPLLAESCSWPVPVPSHLTHS